MNIHSVVVIFKQSVIQYLR